ncbi:MAG: YkgJ family cysteine cluster protein [Patescibacteria group bacterium]|nr:YkgJ family cysteine cluster protein [Patescibacteria group bacterium]
MPKNIFDIICKTCGGKCCKYYIFLTEKELRRLLKTAVKFKYKKQGAGFLMDTPARGCDFLDHKTGCRLNSRQKSLDCKLFPLAFTYKNKTLDFYLLKACPFWKKIDRQCIDKIKAITRRELKSWTEKEKITYSKLIADYTKKELLKL